MEEIVIHRVLLFLKTLQETKNNRLKFKRLFFATIKYINNKYRISKYL